MSLKVRSVYSNPEKNFLLNICVLLRRESIVATPDLLFKFNFAQGLAKGKLGGACWRSLTSIINHQYPTYILNSITKHRSRHLN